MAALVSLWCENNICVFIGHLVGTFYRVEIWYCRLQHDLFKISSDLQVLILNALNILLCMKIPNNAIQWMNGKGKTPRNEKWKKLIAKNACTKYWIKTITNIIQFISCFQADWLAGWIEPCYIARIPFRCCSLFFYLKSNSTVLLAENEP